MEEVFIHHILYIEPEGEENHSCSASAAER